MSYAIIGFGKIGHALANAFARNAITACPSRHWSGPPKTCSNHAP